MNPGLFQNLTRKTIIVPAIILSALIVGCVPFSQRRVAVKPMPRPATKYLLTKQTLKEKIQFFNALCQKKDLPKDDIIIASNLVDAYSLVRKALAKKGIRDPEYHRMIKALLISLNMFEEKYFFGKKGGYWSYPRTMSIFSVMEEEIREMYKAGNFRGVIDRCLDLKRHFGPDAMSMEIGVLYAISLAENGMLKEAVQTGSLLSRKFGKKPDLIFLQTKIAEWELELGHRRKAFSVYKRLLDKLDKQGAMINSLKGKITTIPSRHAMHKEKTENNPSDIDRKVDQLIREHKFLEAKELLSIERKKATSGHKTEMINKAMIRLELSEEQYVNKTIKSVVRLLEQEKFQEAISTIKAFQAKHIERGEILRLKRKAEDGLINNERNRAAKIFLLAKNTEDPIKKAKYLQSSYDILKTLTIKYPSSPLVDRVKANMKIVSRELEKMGIQNP